ncbi:16S rRNA (uracil(1498)-N(3))-methyltransferase [Bacillus salitolerans]|uniref:Ribosomal RNA small subunit methyltransferase E n=1 Tax=Bacillus salitolerans TaxID=1437434 RepID=A0ABW4LNQ8_9BACI
MQRYFVPTSHFNENTVYISGDDVHHISRVMRMIEGDRVYCCNDLGETCISEITKITNEEIELHVVEWLENSAELSVRVSIASGLPKGDKLELIIQKATELGAHQFVPFNAARSIVKWDEKKGDKKIERWNKISKEAAEQSHRSIVPLVQKPISIDELIRISPSFDYKMVAYEEEAKEGEKAKFVQLLSQMKAGQSLLAVFGPEGGLTDKEVLKLNEAGFLSCGLGPRILRTETAPLYVLSAVSYHFELQG